MFDMARWMALTTLTRARSAPRPVRAVTAPQAYGSAQFSHQGLELEAISGRPLDVGTRFRFVYI